MDKMADSSTSKTKNPKVFKHKPQPQDASKAHIPASLRDPVLWMSSCEPIVGNVPTIFVGIMDNKYPEAAWNEHSSRLARLFGVTDEHIAHIKVQQVSEHEIDGEKLGADMTRIIDEINKYDFDILRIVGLGNRGAIAVHEAMEALVRGWKLQWDKKKVHFVALGDSKDNDYLNLCKNLCLNKMCGGVQFYNTMDYSTFGFLNQRRHHENLVASILQQPNIGELVASSLAQPNIGELVASSLAQPNIGELFASSLAQLNIGELFASSLAQPNTGEVEQNRTQT